MTIFLEEQSTEWIEGRPIMTIQQFKLTERTECVKVLFYKLIIYTLVAL